MKQPTETEIRMMNYQLRNFRGNLHMLLAHAIGIFIVSIGGFFLLF